MTHRSRYGPGPTEVRDPVARGLAFAVLLLLLVNIGMTAYVFIVIFRAVEALGQLRL